MRNFIPMQMVQIPTQMDVLHNQETCTDIVSGFQHNTSCSNSTGWTEVLVRDYVEIVVYWVVFLIAFPGICFALYKLRSQVRPDQVASVYVINLLISDLIQICANPIQMSVRLAMGGRFVGLFSWYIYRYSVQVNVLFMMCISAERYVMIAHAVWYRNIQSHKLSIILSVINWSVSVIIWLALAFTHSPWSCMAAILLVPYPVVMFFFVATWRALSRSSVPRHDQIRIRAILGFVLGIYTILFLPFIITLFYNTGNNNDFDSYSMPLMASILVALNPLFDLLLYVLIRRDVSHVPRALLFCCNRGPGTNITNGPDTSI
ncbi:ovarian cancer G-protein coupled receptor 1-like [Engraulis encrasicolus]|uniref:ovarian cancer G-protein coupled receptor 1-like n=1 Tax=Engraulis encrasicolus TaxID=184585 RepID=UPI002FD0CFB9